MTKTHRTCKGKPTAPNAPTAQGKKEPRGSNCGICGKHFQYEHKMRTHLRIHTGETPFSCSYCVKSFAQKAALTVHERTHTGEKPFVCELCNKAFARADHLNQHNRTHTGEKPYACSVCGKSFATWSAISRHKMEHSSRDSYPCSHCNKTFSRSDNLRTHVVKTHLSDKPEGASKVRVAATSAAKKKRAQAKAKEVTKDLDTGSRPNPEEIEAIAKILQDDVDGREANFKDAGDSEIPNPEQVLVKAEPPEEDSTQEKDEDNDGIIKHFDGSALEDSPLLNDAVDSKAEKEPLLEDDEQENADTSCIDDMLGSHFLFA
ncbi:oocyte zinc finger protein XlCOF28-like [Thrips palmi]|uniref:Oocyte zinc finger protein XlCOF28-like n=1 Tax=Thrips palmi TaxID=161013 RepID=A0A6P8ZCL9_THRPL|nr:oocyte zinc finger protein XlCOF28-like [Thrips palmi]